MESLWAGIGLGDLMLYSVYGECPHFAKAFVSAEIFRSGKGVGVKDPGTSLSLSSSEQGETLLTLISGLGLGAGLGVILGHPPQW